MILGIEATSIDRGGGENYLNNLVEYFQPSIQGIDKLVIVSQRSSLSSNIDAKNIELYCPPLLRIRFRVIKYLSRWLWLYFCGKRYYSKKKIDLLLCLSGYNLTNFPNFILVVRNNLLLEKPERQRYGLSLAHFRLILLLYLQQKSVNRCSGIIFLHSYSKELVFGNKAWHKPSVIIPQRSDLNFWSSRRAVRVANNAARCIEVVYPSRFEPYKHQLTVLNAAFMLFKAGIESKMKFIGFEHTPYGDQVLAKFNEIVQHYPKFKLYVEFHAWKSRGDLLKIYNASDVFLFASTCEAYPQTLIEGLFTGLPIVASSKRPMSDILGDAAIYVNPESALSISQGLQKVITDATTRAYLARKSLRIRKHLGQDDLLVQTYAFISSVVSRSKNGS